MAYLKIKETLKLVSELDEKEIEQFIDNHKFNQMIVILCIGGQMEISINMKTYHLQTSSLVTICPELNVKLESLTEDFRCFVVCIQRELLTKAFYVKNLTPIESILLQSPVVCLEDHNMSLFVIFFSFLLQINERVESNYPEIIRCHLMALLMSLKAVYREKRLDKNEEVLSRGKIISHDFMNLVRRYYAKEHQLAFYADKLCLTPKYLMSVVKKHLGYNPKKIINDALIADAKFQLETTDLCVKQICDNLYFPNPSFFGKFFKEHVGVTPKAYRDGRKQNK